MRQLSVLQETIVGSADPPYDIPRYSFKQVTHFILNLLGQVRVWWWLQRTNGMPTGSSFCVLETDTKYSKKKYNPNLQVHRQDLSCSPYAQPLKQAHENFQTYTLKGNLS